MLTRNVKEICSTIFPFSLKFLYFCRGCFLYLLLFPFPFPYPLSLSRFLTAFVAHDACRAAENRSKVLGLKCIMYETRSIVVYLKDTYVSVSAPLPLTACHTHTYTVSHSKGAPAACCTCHLPLAQTIPEGPLKRNEARLQFLPLSLSLSICFCLCFFFFHTR